MGWTDAVQNWLNYSGAKSQANRDESIVMRKGIENAIAKAEAGIPLNQSEKDMINYARQSNQQYGNNLAQEAAMGATGTLSSSFLSKTAKFLNAKGVPRNEIKGILKSISPASNGDDISRILAEKYGNIQEINLSTPSLQYTGKPINSSNVVKLLTNQKLLSEGQYRQHTALNNFMTQEVAPGIVNKISNKQSAIDLVNKSKGYGSNIASNATNFLNNNKMAVGITGLATTTVPAMNYILNGNSEQQKYPNYVEQDNGVTADTVNARVQNTPVVQQQVPVNQPQVVTKQTQPTIPAKQPTQTNVATVAKAAAQRFTKKAWDSNETKKISEAIGMPLTTQERVALGKEIFGSNDPYRGTTEQNAKLVEVLKNRAMNQMKPNNELQSREIKTSDDWTSWL